MGNYRLQENLGSGGMGEVWVASHRMLARSAAVKFIKQEVLLMARSQAVEAYREARKHFEMAEKSMSEVPPHFDVSIGVALSETGETEAAVARFTRAMGKQGVQPIAFWHRANAYLRLDDNAKARAIGLRGQRYFTEAIRHWYSYDTPTPPPRAEIADMSDEEALRQE